jgi:REP element-mobilizing transposase RayT
MGKSRYKILEKAPHFVTCTTINWIALFSSKKIVSILIDSLKFLQENKRMEIYAYVILENHIHLIVSSEKLSKEISNFKSYTARTIIDFLKEKKAKHILNLLNFFKLKHKQDRDYQVWQEGSHPVCINNEQIMRQKIEYIHHNPVKRGYVDIPEHWRYSSARNYANMKGLLEIVSYT